MVDYVDLTYTRRLTEQGGRSLLDKSSSVSVKRINRALIPNEDEVITINGDGTKSTPLSVKRVRRPPQRGEEEVVVPNGGHQQVTVKSPGVKVYNQRGLLVLDGRDACDCLAEDCVGCHYPCTRCQSLKCGGTCRINRSWMYKDVEVEEGVKVRKVCFPNPPAPGTHKL